jgi:hypothetical protein
MPDHREEDERGDVIDHGSAADELAEVCVQHMEILGWKGVAGRVRVRVRLPRERVSVWVGGKEACIILVAMPMAVEDRLVPARRASEAGFGSGWGQGWRSVKERLFEGEVRDATEHGHGEEDG